MEEVDVVDEVEEGEVEEEVGEEEVKGKRNGGYRECGKVED